MNLLSKNGQKKSYLQNEVFIFLNLLETIGRMRDIQVFLLGNPANIYTNPYFLYFDLSLPFNSDIKTFKNNMILLQYMRNDEYRTAKKNTKFGKLISGTSFEDYAINNKCIMNNTNFIEKKSSQAKFNFAFIFENNTYGVWFDFNSGKIYVSSHYVKNTPYLFATTLNDHSPNTLLINTVKSYNCWKTFISAFKHGNVRFENMKIKVVSQNLIKNFLS